MWQDMVYAVGTVFFALALLPTIASKQKPPLLTSFPTALIVFIFALTSATLGLWITVVAQLLGGTFWSIVAWQKYHQNKHQ